VKTLAAQQDDEALPISK